MKPALNRPLPTPWAIALAAAFFAVAFAVAMRSKELDGPWRVDEGKRIAESYFWRLLVARDFSNPAWVRMIDDRGHPPVNKYFFGAAINAAGIAVPRNLDLADAYYAGAPADSMPARFEREYLPMRRAARLAVLALNLLMAAIAMAILLRLGGVLPALLSQLLLFRHFLFVELLFHARSDIVETFLTFVTIVPLLLFARATKTSARMWLAAVAGAIAALAFQTRLNGGVALLMVLVFLVVHSWRTALAPAACAMAAFAAVAVAINPYYWTASPDAAALPFRVIERFHLQVADLRLLLDGVEPQWHLRSLGARFGYTTSILFSGKAGLVIAAGMGIAIVLVALRKADALQRAVIAWALCDLVVIAFWIPLRWEPYLLIVLPPLVLAASLAVAILQRWRWPATRPSNLPEQRAISPSRTSQSRSV